MHSFTAFTAVSLSLVAAFIVPRATRPNNWPNFLESWNIYHNRYLALGCSAKHDTAFFDNCCHPLQAGQTAAADLPSGCQPGNADEFDDEDENGDDCEDDGDETTQMPSPTSALQVPSQTSKAKARIAVTSTRNTATPTQNAAPPSLNTVSTTDVTGGFITYFFQKGNPGACGIIHQDTDFVAAMDSRRYNRGLCGQQVLIEANQRSVLVTIQDDCPTCVNANCIDLSVAAFQNVSDLAKGILNATWSFV